MKQKRAAIYARVSTLDQHPEVQVSALKKYIAQRGWKVAKIYCDKGISGASATRPGLAELMQDCYQRGVDVVVVWKFDRFARSVRHLVTALETFRTLGIDFVSYTEQIDTATAAGEMVFQIVASLAQFERALISERVSEITPDGIEEFKEQRLKNGVRTATVNRDLAVLRHILKLAQRKRLITRTPFDEVGFLEERKQRRRPHIMTFEEEQKVQAVAEPHVRVIMALELETGLRTNCEALMLKWEDVDLVNDVIQVRCSKTAAGVRNVPMSSRCKSELLAWQERLGPAFSPWVFPNMRKPSRPLKDVRKSWAQALKTAGIPYFWIYDLRHTFASILGERKEVGERAGYYDSRRGRNPCRCSFNSA
jgi:DNA invertase Pin-like site-specific DNA recombinase